MLSLLAILAGVLLSGGGAQPAQAAGSLPPLPKGWPSTLQLGLADSPGGASALKSAANFGFRYQYLAGGANTGNGWANWNANGDFAKYYIDDSVANGITPVFTYYQILQSAPGNAQAADPGTMTNLGNTSTMKAYFNDLKLFFQKAAGSNLVVLHVEPDMWGNVQQHASNDNAATVPAQVSSTGLPELAGLPNNMAGFAQAIVKLRDTYAPNVDLGYHLSYWGTGTDPLYSKPSDSEIDALATRSANFYKSLGANFDVSFAEFSDRDAAFYQYQYGNPNMWWAAGDFARNARYLSTFSNLTQKRIVMWQIPLGNTKMRAMDNSWGHYQDNRPEWLLDDAARVNLSTYVNSGVIAFMFGGGAAGTTCACDSNGDGVTNPAAINGNTTMSYSADDDGGYFKVKAKAYYAAGAMSLSGGSPAPTATPTKTATSTPTKAPTQVPTSTPTKAPTQAPTSTPTKTATPRPTSTPTTPPVVAGWSSTGNSSAATINKGQSERVTITARGGANATALVDVEVYGPNGFKLYQKFYDNQSFAAGATKSYSASVAIPRSAPSGQYTVMVGIFSPGWGSLYNWNSSVSTFTVR
jgi:hypothetical protein